MTLTLLAEWRARYGPLDRRMPVDPSPTLLSFSDALAAHQLLLHEDWEDRLNADGSWGVPEVGSVGGSGISLGYSSADLEAVLVAESGVRRRAHFYDWEHWIRQIRYCIAAWEMTRDPQFARRLVAYDAIATGALSDSPDTVHLDDPAWIPFSIAQYREMARQRPHQGLVWNNRATGWIGYGHAMRLKVAPLRLTHWADVFIEASALAAMPGTGQLGSGEPNHEDGITYCFHQGIHIHATLALVYRLGRPIPGWVFDWMNAVEQLTPMDYGGFPSMPSYVYTRAGRLHAANRPDQHGDPAYGWHSSNCVAIAGMTNDPSWLKRAAKFGPQTVTDEQSRKHTMLLRGALSA